MVAHDSVEVTHCEIAAFFTLVEQMFAGSEAKVSQAFQPMIIKYGNEWALLCVFSGPWRQCVDTLNI